MSRTELASRFLYSAREFGARGPAAVSRLFLFSIGWPVRTVARATRELTLHLEQLHNDGVTSSKDLGNAVADWIQEQVQP